MILPSDDVDDPDLVALRARLAGGCTIELGTCVCPAAPYEYAGCRARPRDAFWQCYGKCPICAAGTGEPCVALSGQVAGGRPDGVPVPLAVAHSARKRLVRAAVPGACHQLFEEAADG